MTIQIRKDHFRSMLQDVQDKFPEEACGLLAGSNSTSSWVYPIENELHSPIRFLMQPEQQLRAMISIENNGWDVLAIYHSHPRGPEQPSETDILEHYYPDTCSLIFYKQETGWDCKAYQIRDGEFSAIDIEFLV